MFLEQSSEIIILFSTHLQQNLQKKKKEENIKRLTQSKEKKLGENFTKVTCVGAS